MTTWTGRTNPSTTTYTARPDLSSVNYYVDEAGNFYVDDSGNFYVDGTGASGTSWTGRTSPSTTTWTAR